MNKNLNNELEKDRISFGGRGKLVHEYQAYTEVIGERLLARWRKVIGEASGDLKAHLKKIGLVSEDDRVLKSITIADGDDYIDESQIQGAENIFQYGGVLDEMKLTGENITVLGGQNIGAHANSHLHLEGDNYTPNPISNGKITAKDTNMVGDVKCQELITQGNVTNGGSIEASVVMVRGDSHLKNLGNCETVELHGTSTLDNINKAAVVRLYDDSILTGGENSNIGLLEMTGHSKANDISIIQSLKSTLHAKIIKVTELYKAHCVGNSELAEVQRIKGKLTIGGYAKVKNVNEVQNDVFIHYRGEFHGKASEKDVKRVALHNVKPVSNVTPCKSESTTKIWGKVTVKDSGKLLNVDQVGGSVIVENAGLISGINEIGAGINVEQAAQIRLLEMYPEMIKKLCISELNEPNNQLISSRLDSIKIPKVEGLETLKKICIAAVGSNNIEASNRLYTQILNKIGSIELKKNGNNLILHDAAQVNPDQIYETVVRGQLLVPKDAPIEPKVGAVHIEHSTPSEPIIHPTIQAWNVKAIGGSKIEREYVNIYTNSNQGLFSRISSPKAIIQRILPNYGGMKV